MFYTFYDYIKNKYFHEVSSLAAPEREAYIFKKTVEEIPLAINDNDIIAGRYGCDDGDAYKVIDDQKFEYINAYSPEEMQIKDILHQTFCINTRFDRAHCCIDYGHIINFGLKSYELKIKNELSKPDLSDDKKIMLRAMLTSIDAVRIYTERFLALADSSDDARLARIKNAMSRVPYEPAEDFYEAVSAVWIMHSLIPIAESSWASVSLGRVDQYLYPFYKKALQNGESEDSIKDILKNLIIYLNTYGDGACALNIGGMDENGCDEMNELSRLIIEVEKEMLLPSPILTPRINPNTPEDIIDSLIDLKLFRIGQPTFYGELPCRNALKMRGIPESDIKQLTINSCMGLYIPGKEIASMWGCVFNMHLPLELAVNCGEPLFGQLPIDIEKSDEINDLESIFTAYEHYLRQLMRVSFAFNRKNAVNIAVNRPDPLLSAITEGCVESGLDRSIGAVYNTETVETMGLVNTANAICAIDTLVFCEHKYAVSDFISAARVNYEGFDDLLRDIRRCEKYGTNSQKPDSICRKLCEITYKICKEFSNENVYFLPSLHTLDSNVSFGRDLYTTLDGRLAGTPVNKNAGPTNDVRSSDPTSLIISAASIGQELFSGGQPIDLYFDRSLFDSKEKRDKIKTLVKSYLQLGGLQLQVNSVDVELLEEAYDDPASHPELIVRIGGYSLRFADLNKGSQREFIDRFKRERV